MYHVITHYKSRTNYIPSTIKIYIYIYTCTERFTHTIYLVIVNTVKKNGEVMSKLYFVLNQ